MNYENLPGGNFILYNTKCGDASGRVRGVMPET